MLYSQVIRCHLPDYKSQGQHSRAEVAWTDSDSEHVWNVSKLLVMLWILHFKKRSTWIWFCVIMVLTSLFYLQLPDSTGVGVPVDHDLYILDFLLSLWPWFGHLICYLLGCFLKLSHRKKQESKNALRDHTKMYFVISYSQSIFRPVFKIPSITNLLKTNPKLNLYEINLGSKEWVWYLCALEYGPHTKLLISWKTTLWCYIWCI